MGRAAGSSLRVCSCIVSECGCFIESPAKFGRAAPSAVFSLRLAAPSRGAPVGEPSTLGECTVPCPLPPTSAKAAGGVPADWPIMAAIFFPLEAFSANGWSRPNESRAAGAPALPPPGGGSAGAPLVLVALSLRVISFSQSANGFFAICTRNKQKTAKNPKACAKTSRKPSQGTYSV